jgi:hypothetical protein
MNKIKWKVEKSNKPAFKNLRTLILENNKFFCRLFYYKNLYYGYIFNEDELIDVEVSEKREIVQNFCELEYKKSITQ